MLGAYQKFALVSVTRRQILVDGTAVGDTESIQTAGRLTRVGELFNHLKAKRELWRPRLLGYRSNVACNWEARRRFPTARRTLAICRDLGVDVAGALARFVPQVEYELDDFRMGAWLDALRGTSAGGASSGIEASLVVELTHRGRA